MKKVFAAGSFNLLHPGHLSFLEQAKQLGTHLTVVVASDENVKKKLGFSIVPAEDRRRLIASLKCVDEALVGGVGDIFTVLNRVRPDIIALGYDQAVNIAELKARLKKYSITADIRRIPKKEGYSSSLIVSRIKKHFC